MAANLPGSGTQEDPYRIESYEDFSKMDSLETGAYYKLVKDINMIGKKWYGINLNGGYLDLSDRKIENVDIADGSFCFYAGTIYAQREEWFDGVKIKENKAGYILNITSELCEFIFKNIDFVRIGWSIINISSSSQYPVDYITGLESYFWISSLNFKNTFIRLRRVGDNEYSLCDCVVSINGNFFDNYVIRQHTDASSENTICRIKRCLITGKIKTLGTNGSSIYENNGLICNTACASCIIDIEHDPDTYDGNDFQKCIMTICVNTSNNSIIKPIKSTGNSVYVLAPSSTSSTLSDERPGIHFFRNSEFVGVTKSQLLNTGYLKTIQFNVEPENQG